MSPTITIPVFGVVGSGKTSFINVVSGSCLPVGNGYEACTLDMTHVGIPLVTVNGLSIQLVDTPGFNNPSVGNDLEILERISKYLTRRFKQNECFGGVIYLHSIAETRIGNASKAALTTFQYMCGKRALCKSAFLTTMWSSPPTSRELAKEEELRQHSNVCAISPSIVMRIERRTRLEGISILRRLVSISHDPCPFDLQVELGMGGDEVPLWRTAAGLALTPDLADVAEDQHKVNTLRGEYEGALNDRNMIDTKTKRDQAEFESNAWNIREARRLQAIETIRRGGRPPGVYFTITCTIM
ncbi:unnamed protein product [Rhizoctonia solani]|uniref:G domain-containing protein n=1 Tax=Rhizoctonia solani TaxID=456999 RepID=A0A8H2WMB3_9AGAM|nr:unnamed protein product [Rhizoctonia solani]